MKIYTCPCCGDTVRTIGTLVFHPCPKRNRELRDYKLIGTENEDGTTSPVSRTTRKATAAPSTDGLTPAQRAWATRRAAMAVAS